MEPTRDRLRVLQTSRQEKAQAGRQPGKSMTDFEQVSRRIAALAAEFSEQRAERQQRRSLEAVDFEALRDAGFLRVGVPRRQGGLWDSVAGSTRPLCDLLRTLARGDSSVALVSAMHPAVLSYWLATPEIEVGNEAWQQQRGQIFDGVMRGDWWGTITSEPGTGGDVTRSKMKAEPSGRPLQYRLSGAKHFGSGSGILRYMVTTAAPIGEEQPDWFYVDMRDTPWDGSQGVKLLAAWDGHGMAATQSHSLRFDKYPGTRIAWTNNLTSVAARSGGFIGCLFTSVIVGIVDVAMHTARQVLASRERLGPYEQVEAARAETEAWLIEQALAGMLRAVEQQADPRREVLQGKTAIAELAESLLNRLCRIVGGGTFSRRSPFGFWFEDVRALGFLRPPWALAFDGLIGWLGQESEQQSKRQRH